MVKSDLTGFGLCVVWPIAGLRHWADKEPTSANPNRGRLGPAKIKSEAAQCLNVLEEALLSRGNSPLFFKAFPPK